MQGRMTGWSIEKDTKKKYSVSGHLKVPVIRQRPVSETFKIPSDDSCPTSYGRGKNSFN